MEENSRRTRWGLFGAIIIVSIFLRFFRIGHQSFWIDEILTVGAYASPAGGVSFWKKLLWDVHGPLYSFFLHFWSMAGSSEAWLRMPSAAAGVLSVIFFYRWISATAGWKRGMTGAFLLAISPLNIYYSQELRFYSFLILFLVLSLLAFREFVEEPSMKKGSILGLFLGLACLSHFMALFLCAALFVFMAVTGRVRGKWLGPGIVSAAIVLLMVSPWVYRELYYLNQITVTDISTLADEEKLRGELTLNIWAYPYTFYAFSTGYSFGPDLRVLHGVTSGIKLIREHWLTIVPVFLIFGATAVGGLVRAFREKLLLLFLSVAVVTIASTTIAAMLNIKVFNARYLMCIFPVFIAVLAFGIPERKVPGTIVLSLIAVFMLISDWNYHFNPRYARDDVRKAVSIISSMEEEGDMIMAPGSSQVVDHYYSGENRIETYSPFSIGEERALDRLTSDTARYRRIWYVGSRQWNIDPGGALPGLLSKRSAAVESWRMPGVLLVLYTFEI